MSVLSATGRKLAQFRDLWIPSSRAARGIRWLTWIGVLVFGGAYGLGFRLGSGRGTDVLVGVALAALLLVVARWVILLLGWLGRWSIRFLTLWGLAGVFAMVYAYLYSNLTWYIAILFGLVFALVQIILGAALAHLLGKGVRRMTATVALVLAVGADVAMVAVFHSEGRTTDPTKELILPLGPTPALYAELLNDGPWKVGKLTYGSGTDEQRADFSTDVAFRSKPVDASRMLTGLKGWRAKAREYIWGFGAKALPVNARVWYPIDRKDKAPIILVVHGNHSMRAYSDPGYAYIGEHLASRGFIVASVDENFLNSGAFVGSMQPENEVRGWLLLEHLRQWRSWNLDPKNPFFGKVDLNRVVLIGHSRGGEAMGIAAAFNSLKYYPDDARVVFDFNFGLRGVIAIAPVDGQYLPSTKRTPVQDVSYFVLQGGYDMDVSSYQGDKQYQRVTFTPGSNNFKAGLYIHNANHGQFNTTWGRYDGGAPGSWLLNVRPMMPPEEQRKVALLFITAFVEERLLDRSELRPLFQEPTRAGSILPATLYVGHYADDQRREVADFEDGIDITRGTLPGSTLHGDGLKVWKETDLHLRKEGQRYDTASVLGWSASSARAGTPAAPSSWTVKFPQQPGLSSKSAIELDLAQLDEDVPSADPAKKTPPLPWAAMRPAVDFSVEVTDAAGAKATLPLSHFGRLLPPLPVRHSKLGSWAMDRYGKPTEPVVHTMHLPLADFVGVKPEFDPASLVAIRLVFDRSPMGVVGISDIGLEP